MSAWSCDMYVTKRDKQKNTFSYNTQEPSQWFWVRICLMMDGDLIMQQKWQSVGAGQERKRVQSHTCFSERLYWGPALLWAKTNVSMLRWSYWQHCCIVIMFIVLLQRVRMLTFNTNHRVQLTLMEQSLLLQICGHDYA